MTKTMTHVGTLHVLECGECSIPHAIPESLYRDRLNNGGDWWCPNGHKLHFITTEAEKLKRRLASSEQRREWAEARETSTRDQLAATERSLRGHKAAKTRMKNRVAAGLCPCCRRRFENLANHMAGQHPDYTHAEGD